MRLHKPMPRRRPSKNTRAALAAQARAAAASPLERDAEGKFCREVKDRGGITRKMNGLGFRSWPDRAVVKPKVKPLLWIEFKRKGEPLTPLQQQCHWMLQRMGQQVITCYTVEQALIAYDLHR